ncbi:hypothetical protein FNV43_RR16990 [Rhamnella rubrinervis]|uniref:Myb/SANT-like domain-containing protein n=1 Tax=Rhamnella rubrinervis TaxID=2594499 RepID=A0A8K0GZS8_9ROSA|nr:hypothetical protein FNV43_RR16990 [Rhamnella rubrinervis]
MAAGAGVARGQPVGVGAGWRRWSATVASFPGDVVAWLQRGKERGEGLVPDSRVLHDAISRPNGLRVLSGYYYLVDASYTNGEGFLAPYKGISYHLSEWRDASVPVTPEEYFNMKHASTRNVIECCFGILKMCWAILRRMGSRRVWTREEEETLLDILDDVVARGQCCDMGSFKVGTMTMIERSLAQKCPESGLKINPHIESKLKKWKKQYGIIYDILSKSGFGWNDTLKCVEVDSNEAWKANVESNKQAEGWRGKSFPIYDRFLNIFGKDRATGFSEVSEKMCSSFQQTTKERMKQFTNSIQPIEANYPKYLAIELKRLGFSTKDNLNISKAMRMDPSKVEVFKIIKTDAKKIEFVLSFKPE